MSQGQLDVLGPRWAFLNLQPQVLGLETFTKQNWCGEAPAPVRVPTLSLVAQPPPQQANSWGQMRASWWEDSNSYCITNAWSGHWLGHHKVLVNLAKPPVRAGSLPLALGRLRESQSPPRPPPHPGFLLVPLPLGESLHAPGSKAHRREGRRSQHCDWPGRELLPASGLGGVIPTVSPILVTSAPCVTGILTTHVSRFT